MRYSLLELPEPNPKTVLPAETVQPPALAQINVIPFDSDKSIRVPPQLYEPLANVTVAPSLALAITLLTSDGVVPAAQDHEVPLPEQVAAAGMTHKIAITPT